MENKIGNSKYNMRYKDIIAQGLLEYLGRKGWKRSQKIIARWRCGNEEERNKERYWKNEKGRRCLICEEREGTIQHIMTHVDETITVGIENILSEEGKRDAIRWMEVVRKLRKGKKGQIEE